MRALHISFITSTWTSEPLRPPVANSSRGPGTGDSLPSEREKIRQESPDPSEGSDTCAATSEQVARSRRCPSLTCSPPSSIGELCRRRRDLLNAASKSPHASDVSGKEDLCLFSSSGCLKGRAPLSFPSLPWVSRLLREASSGKLRHR